MITRGTIIAWLFLSGLLLAASLETELSAPSAAAGEGVVLTIKVSGGRPDAEPVLPEIENLIIQPRGQSQQIRIENGRTTRTIVYTYVVGSQVPGEYVIPPITLRVAGENVISVPIKLSVGVGPAGDPAGIPDGEEPETTPEKSGDYGYLAFQMLERERKHIYPGEIVPVRIEAYFHANSRVSLKGPPRPDGNSFVLHNLTQEPQQTSRMVNGQSYIVVTWFGGMSATKAGNYPAGFELSGTVAVRDPAAARGRRGAFDDPFAGRMLDDFFAPMVQKEVELITSEVPEIEVSELPVAGRPDDFTGAIGQFEFAAVEVPGTGIAGEPLEMAAVIEGSGNFSLLEQPRPRPAGDWKSYDGKSAFAADDAASFGGKKSFRFRAVPTIPGQRVVALEFSYFDPDRGEYQVMRSDGKEILITGTAMEMDAAVAEPSPDDTAAPPSVPDLAPLRTSVGAVHGREWWLAPRWFWTGIGGSGAMALVVFGAGWWRQRLADPQRVARAEIGRRTKEAMATADRAAKVGDTAGFFISARSALQLAIAQRQGIRPEAVTAVDLGGIHDRSVIELFDVADRFEYSGHAEAAGELEQWRERLISALAELEPQRKGWNA